MAISAISQSIMPITVLDMIEMEMVARSIRRIVRDYLQRLPELRTAPAGLFAKLLSCILGPAVGYARSVMAWHQSILHLVTLPCAPTPHPPPPPLPCWPGLPRRAPRRQPPRVPLVVTRVRLARVECCVCVGFLLLLCVVSLVSQPFDE